MLYVGGEIGKFWLQMKDILDKNQFNYFWKTN
jgi:hypothetical protein